MPFGKSKEPAPPPPPPPPAPTARENLRQNRREIQHSQREIDREINNLKREEKKIQDEIKSLVKKGNQPAARVLAKSLVKNQQQQAKLSQAKYQMGSISNDLATNAATAKMANTIGNVNGVMESANAMNDPKKMMQTLQQYEKQQMKMNMGQEMMDDAFEGMMDGVDDEADDVLASVLDEIGLEYGQGIQSAPMQQAGVIPNKATAHPNADQEADDLIARLAGLKN